MYFDPVRLSRMQFAWVIAWQNHAMATMATFIQTPASGFLGEISDRSGWKNNRDIANISLKSWRQ
jgi:hypothetical protein